MASIKPKLPLESLEADIIFQVDVERSIGRPTRGFAATDAFLKACEELAATLLPQIQSVPQPVVVLENVIAGSVITWLRYDRNADRQEGGDENGQADASNFLILATLAIIRWLNGSKPPFFPELKQHLQDIAARTGVANDDGFRLPTKSSLGHVMGLFEGIKNPLLVGDRATLLTAEGNVGLDPATRLTLEEIDALPVSTVTEGSVEMVLVVVQPDYSGTGAWRMRHGDETLDAVVEDKLWLDRFLNRQLDIRPGDVIRASVKTRYSYAHDGELIGRSHSILSCSTQLQTSAKN